MFKKAWSTRSVAVISLSTFSVTLCAAPDAAGATRVPLRQIDRSCDFSPNLPVRIPGFGSASAMINRAGSGVAADVALVYGSPDTHYDVLLIQAPRPSSATCGTGDPGTAAGSFSTDPAGSGSVTVQDRIRPGTTGVWVTVQRPAEHSQSPAEFYSSDFIAPV